MIIIDLRIVIQSATRCCLGSFRIIQNSCRAGLACKIVLKIDIGASSRRVEVILEENLSQAHSCADVHQYGIIGVNPRSIGQTEAGLSCFQGCHLERLHVGATLGEIQCQLAIDPSACWNGDSWIQTRNDDLGPR